MKFRILVILCGLAVAAGATEGETPLWWAIANNDALAAWKLTDPTLETPWIPLAEDLNGAVQRGSGEVFDVLAYRGAPADAILATGENLLFAASSQGRLDLFRKIARAGARLEQLDDLGRGVLHAGAKSPQPVMVAYLLEKGLPAAQRSELGVTPLMVACQAGRLANVETLLDWGANPEDEDYLGRSVLWYAQAGADADVLARLDAELQPVTPEAEASPADAAPLP